MPGYWNAHSDLDWYDACGMFGPEDEFDDEANGDPDSLVGDDDEGGFEELAGWPDEPLIDDGFEDAEEAEDDEDTEIDDDDEEE